MITVLRIEDRALSLLSKAPPMDCTLNVHHSHACCKNCLQMFHGWPCSLWCLFSHRDVGRVHLHSYIFKRTSLPFASGKVSVEITQLYIENGLQLEDTQVQEFFHMKRIFFSSQLPQLDSSRVAFMNKKQVLFTNLLMILKSSPSILVPFLVCLKLL